MGDELINKEDELGQGRVVGGDELGRGRGGIGTSWEGTSWEGTGWNRDVVEQRTWWDGDEVGHGMGKRTGFGCNA